MAKKLSKRQRRAQRRRSALKHYLIPKVRRRDGYTYSDAHAEVKRIHP